MSGCTACDEKKKQADSMPHEVEQGPARKAEGGIGESFAGIGEQLAESAQQNKPASSVAADGFTGVGQELPDREFHEKSFGRSFSNVRVYTDDAAAAACRKLNARAYTVGNKIAFADSSLLQNKALVAHELTHVGQHTGDGPARKANGGADADGIDRSGEDEAERVEAAVGDGKPARSALADESGEGGGDGKGPARSSPWGAAFELDANELKLQGSYSFGQPVEVPIPSVPGLNVLINPSFAAKVQGGAGTFRNRGNFSVGVGLEGDVQVGLSYGKCSVACVYLTGGATASGGFEFKQEGNHWHFQGEVKFEANLNFGVKLVPNWGLDYKYKFASIELGKLVGLRVIGTHGVKGPTLDGTPGFTWGPELQATFDQFAKPLRTIQSMYS
jgi:hypothetical protein